MVYEQLLVPRCIRGRGFNACCRDGKEKFPEEIALKAEMWGIRRIVK